MADATGGGPAALPIRKYAADIVKAVKANQVVVVIGETGSGKTTQISQVRWVLPGEMCSPSGTGTA